MLEKESKTSTNSKVWYRSKTLVFNLIVLGAALFAPFISDDIRKYMIGMAVPNIILRLRTQDGISGGNK